MTLNEWVVGILGGVASTAIVAIASRSWIVVRRRVPTKSMPVRGSLAEAVESASALAEIELYLVSWLEDDQSPADAEHAGEFGATAKREEELLYQPKSAPLDPKPRLYLTGWPVRILTELDLAQQLVQRALVGLRRFDGGLVAQPLAIGGAADAGRSSEISIRHSLRAVQIGLSGGMSWAVYQPVLNRMVDPAFGWQQDDGSWLLSENVYRVPDIWSSAYALALLDDIAGREQLGAQMMAEATRRRALTVEYMATAWERDKWAVAGASGAQNGLLVAHEVLGILGATEPNLYTDVASWCRSWRTPTGSLSHEYLAQTVGLSPAAASIRLAFALWLCSESVDALRQLLDDAILGFEAGLNSADTSFLLRLVAECDVGDLARRIGDRRKQA